jgi:hypothetical protein
MEKAGEWQIESVSLANLVEAYKDSFDPAMPTTEILQKIHIGPRYCGCCIYVWLGDEPDEISECAEDEGAEDDSRDYMEKLEDPASYASSESLTYTFAEILGKRYAQT